MIATVVSIKQAEIKRKINGLKEDQDHQVEQWAEAFHRGDKDSYKLVDIANETDEEIAKLERLL